MPSAMKGASIAPTDGLCVRSAKNRAADGVLNPRMVGDVDVIGPRDQDVLLGALDLEASNEDEIPTLLIEAGQRKPGRNGCARLDERIDGKDVIGRDALSEQLPGRSHGGLATSALPDDVHRASGASGFARTRHHFVDLAALEDGDWFPILVQEVDEISHALIQLPGAGPTWS